MTSNESARNGGSGVPFESLLAHLADRAGEAEALRRVPESTIEHVDRILKLFMPIEF